MLFISHLLTTVFYQMNTYPIILAIFIVAMSSIISSHKKNTCKAENDLTHIPKINKIKNIESKLVSDDFDELHTHEVSYRY